MRTSKGLLVAALSMGIAAGMPMSIQKEMDKSWEYKAPRGGRGHWMGSINCKHASKARLKSKRAKQARKLHRKANCKAK